MQRYPSNRAPVLDPSPHHRQIPDQPYYCDSELLRVTTRVPSPCVEVIQLLKSSLSIPLAPNAKSLIWHIPWFYIKISIAHSPMW